MVKPFFLGFYLELDRYIGNTHHRVRLQDNPQTMTIGDQFMPMFHNEVTPRIRRHGMFTFNNQLVQFSCKFATLKDFKIFHEFNYFVSLRPISFGSICASLRVAEASIALLKYLRIFRSKSTASFGKRVELVISINSYFDS